MGSPVAESPVKKGGGHSPSKMSASADEPAEEYDDEFEEDEENGDDEDVDYDIEENVQSILENAKRELAEVQKEMDEEET